MANDPTRSTTGCLATLIAAPLGWLWSGYVLSVLWSWFVVPALSAAPLFVWQAVGLILLVRLATPSTDTSFAQSKLESEGEVAVFRIGTALVKPAVLLGIGWVTRLFA